MKANLYYGVFLVAALLVFVVSGPASFASPADATQLTETTDEIEALPERIVTVAVAKGSNGTFQNYTYTPQSVEINAGESVTWFSPVDPDVPVDIHTVTFVGNPSILDDMTVILPFAIPGAATDFDPIPPFEVGEPLITETPDGRQAIIAANKNAFYPAVIDGNSQTTYLNGTDIQYTLNGTEMALNSGIILPQLPPLGEAEANDTGPGTAGGELSSETSPTNETITATNATTTDTTPDTTTVPDDQGTSAETEGEEQLAGAPFPIVSSFTVTFEEPGTYPYLCAIHPWMSGQVVVSEEEIQTEAQAQNQTEAQALGESGSVNPIFG